MLGRSCAHLCIERAPMATALLIYYLGRWQGILAVKSDAILRINYSPRRSLNILSEIAFDSTSIVKDYCPLEFCDVSAYLLRKNEYKNCIESLNRNDQKSTIKCYGSLIHSRLWKQNICCREINAATISIYCKYELMSIEIDRCLSLFGYENIKRLW